MQEHLAQSEGSGHLGRSPHPDVASCVQIVVPNLRGTAVLTLLRLTAANVYRGLISQALQRLAAFSEDGWKLSF